MVELTDFLGQELTWRSYYLWLNSNAQNCLTVTVHQSSSVLSGVNHSVPNFRIKRPTVRRKQKTNKENKQTKQKQNKNKKEEEKTNSNNNTQNNNKQKRRGAGGGGGGGDQNKKYAKAKNLLDLSVVSWLCFNPIKI